MSSQKHRKLIWSDEKLKMFNDLKSTLALVPILAFPNFKIPFVVQTDASNIGISRVLLQKQSNLFRPVAFCSRKLNKTERNSYSTSERELLAVVYAYEQFTPYLYGREVKFLTDHKPLVTAQNLKRPGDRLGRLFNRLQDVNYKFEYIEGKNNRLPDFLSRAFDPEPPDTELNHLNFVSKIDWVSEQSNDPEITKIIDFILKDADEAEWLSLTNGRRWFNERRNLYLHVLIINNILYYNKNKIVCPFQMRRTILENFHDSKFSGHRSADFTIKLIRSR